MFLSGSLCPSRRLFLKHLMSFGSAKYSPPAPLARSIYLKPEDDLIPTLTTEEVTKKYAEDFGTELYYSNQEIVEVMRMRKGLLKFLPKTQDELPARRMRDSLLHCIIPIKTDPAAKTKYMNVFNTIRVGRILQDMDAVAVHCAFKYLNYPKAEGQRVPVAVVTGAVLSSYMSKYRLNNVNNIRLTAHVSWVGKTSMQVSIMVDQKDLDGKWMMMTDTVFFMNVRDAIMEKSAIANPLVADSPEEKAFIAKGDAIKNQVITETLDTYISLTPTDEERKILDKMLMGTSEKKNHLGGTYFENQAIGFVPKGASRMCEVRMSRLILCNPVERNRYHRMYGGFIMRNAMELAFSVASLFCQERPKLVNLDNMIFKKPVEIGNILDVRARIGYVEGKFMHIPVHCFVLDPVTGSKDLTSVMSLTYGLMNERELPHVWPQTYEEVMVFLASRRSFKKLMAATPADSDSALNL